jgi:hypothetical protein
MKVTTVATATKTAVQVAWFVIELRAIDVPSSGKDGQSQKKRAMSSLPILPPSMKPTSSTESVRARGKLVQRAWRRLEAHAQREVGTHRRPDASV